MYTRTERVKPKLAHQTEPEEDRRWFGGNLDGVKACYGLVARTVSPTVGKFHDLEKYCMVVEERSLKPG